jgi:hypothetical protein
MRQKIIGGFKPQLFKTAGQRPPVFSKIRNRRFDIHTPLEITAFLVIAINFGDYTIVRRIGDKLLHPMRDGYL